MSDKGTGCLNISLNSQDLADICVSYRPEFKKWLIC
jgi:hypothetical protein